MQHNWSIPDGASRILARLNQYGYEAYLVGGCVRDLVMGRKPHDWDICTNAKPEQVVDIFKDKHVIEAGLKHGTVSVVDDGVYEVTTYRIDGEYEDGRHPKKVKFVSDLREDLARRDFTINAMALGHDGNIIDFFGGVSDANKRIVRCVGRPADRFGEDWLRIMRAMRFASVLGFDMDAETLSYIQSVDYIPNGISAERIQAELRKMVVGINAAEILRQCKNILFLVAPELRDMDGFHQNSPYHIYDVFEHTLHAIDYAPRNETVRLALLFHDAGKPYSYSEDQNGVGHFYGHPALSEPICRDVMSRLRFENRIIEDVAHLVKYHDITFNCERTYIKRCLNKHGRDMLNLLIFVRASDIYAQSPVNQSERLAKVRLFSEMLQYVYDSNECFSLRNLAVNGKDLIQIGFKPGPDLGKMLSILLENVMDGKLKNEKEVLLEFALPYLTVS